MKVLAIALVFLLVAEQRSCNEHVYFKSSDLEQDTAEKWPKYFKVPHSCAGLTSTTVAEAEESAVAHVRVRRGFGCPLNQGACHRHCRSIGRRGGYCAGIIKQTCTCYRK